MSMTNLMSHCLGELFKQSCHDNNVLARPSEVRGTFVVAGALICEDSLVDVVGDGACAPTVRAAVDLALEFGVLLLQLEPRFLELLLPLPHLFKP